MLGLHFRDMGSLDIMLVAVGKLIVICFTMGIYRRLESNDGLVRMESFLNLLRYSQKGGVVGE